MVDSAFLLVAAKHAGDLPPVALELVQDPRARGLGFEPTAHVQWRDNAGTIVFGGWQGPTPRPDASAWHVDGNHLVMALGQAWWRDLTGEPARSLSASDLAHASRRLPFDEVVEDLRGIFAIVRLGAGGDAAVATDPLGFRCLYLGESPDAVAISSRAELVARGLNADGRAPVRDALGSCWLAYTTYRIGDSTGFEGVRVLPAGGIAEIRPRRGLRVTSSAPWMPDPHMRESTPDDIVELVRADITASLRAILELPAERHVVGLTGGKDSRLILAVALGAGLAHDFEYETIGPPDLADVRVASELAAQFGLRHTVRFLGLGSDRPYGERIRDFVAVTGGMLNIWDLSDPSAVEDEVRVVGLCGEALRVFRRISKGMRSRDDLVERFSPRDFGRLQLVRRQGAGQLHRMLLDALLDDPSGRSEPSDLFDAFYMRNRVRFSRTGPREELPGQLRVMPLYSICALRAAFALGTAARQSELLHREITFRCSELLANHRFAGPGWVRATEEPAGRPGLSEHPRRAEVEEPRATEKPEALMAKLQQSAFSDRKQAFLPLVEDRTNPAWELIDRRAAAAALERFPTLTPIERRELYGAFTAALWLGDGAHL
jgi:hypothetical protein